MSTCGTLPPASNTATISSAELATLTRCFQQRHLLAHTQGLVDADYIARTGDTAYRIGQRIVIREAAVRECLALTEKLAAGMAHDAVASAVIETGGRQAGIVGCPREAATRTLSNARFGLRIMVKSL